MASILNDRFELIEPLPAQAGDFARATYKARETVATAEGDAPAGRVVLMRLLPAEAIGSSLTDASEQAARLRAHPNIIAHYGLAQIEGQPGIEPGLYVVSEYARGLTLRERIRRVAPFSLAVALDIALSVTKAVAHAHERGIAHGNLRPEQVLLAPEGAVRVADFAVSRAAHEALGDPDEAYADDTRAVGLLLYEMLTGVAPDQMGVVGEDSPREINQAIPSALDSIVRKATSLDPARRYGSPAALLTDLQTAREDLRAGKPLNWSALSPAKGGGARPAGGQAQPGALTAAAEEIAAEKAGRQRGGNAPIGDSVDDYPAERTGASMFSRVAMGLFIVIVVLVIALSAYFATLLSVPNDVVVPDLIGRQFTDAQQQAAREHLSLVKAGDDYSDSVPTGAIYQMQPAPGVTIKSGKEISVYVSDGPRLADVPDLTQGTLDKAKETLGAAGLPVGPIVYQYSDSAAKGNVISQEPTAGSKVSHDTPINLVVSNGPPPPPAPAGLSATSTIDGEVDLSWDEVADAATYNVYRDGRRIATGVPQNAYSDENLGPGETHSYAVTAVDANGESAKSQAVSATTPAPPPPPQTVAPGGEATAPGPAGIVAPAPTTPGPDNGTLKQRTFHIRFRVPQGGSDRHNVQIEVQDATGTNIAYDEDRDSGDTVDQEITAFGNKIIFRIFIDGNLVKQEVK